MLIANTTKKHFVETREFMSNNGHLYKDAAVLARSFVFLVFCSFFLLTGCTAIKGQRNVSGHSRGQIDLFLKGADDTSVDISFDLTAIDIMAEDGTYREITSTPLNINSIAVKGRQILLAEKSLPEGRYKKLRLVVKRALIRRKGRMARLALPSGGIEVAVNITVYKDQDTSLFLTWDADASVADKYLFKPVFAVKGQVPELSSLLVYVTNEDSNNVSVINRQLGEVVATVRVGRRPRGIAAGLRRDRLRVYVANSGSNSISVIDPTTNKVEQEIPIRFGSAPEGIAVARGPSGEDLIFVTDYASDTVSVVDAATYQEIDKVDVGNGPIAVAVDPPAETVTASRFLSLEDVNILRNYRERYFNVYVVNKDSRDVSVLRMDLQSGRLEEVARLSVEWSPVALAIDYQRGKVYVANYGSDRLSVIDIIKVIKGDEKGAVSDISDVGTSVTGVVVDPSFDRLYLLRKVPGEIMIIRPFLEDYYTVGTVMPLVIGTIPVGTSPRSMIMDPEVRNLYVVNRGSDNVSVVDRTAREVERIIPVGKNPYGIAMFPY
ncbi:hypothetical protein MNBD_NITROSPIRAE03-1461 [hydrothermal vent metagenome]|uniref:DUF4382 domain-containing protein n=1 Tax=hydrothermal vent metagenome TaxID=652676 RepID=A0A3B1DEW8_9ZZZZ